MKFTKIMALFMASGIAFSNASVINAEELTELNMVKEIKLEEEIDYEGVEFNEKLIEYDVKAQYLDGVYMIPFGFPFYC